MNKIGHPEMIGDPRFGNDMDRFHNTPLIDPVVKEWVTGRTVAEVTKACEEARVPCGPVQTVDQLLTDPQLKARDMIQVLDYPGLGKVHIPAMPMKLSLTPTSINTPSPGLGEHNEEIYKGLLGLSTEKMSRLKQEKII